jgi:hypothetical protein
MRVPAHRRTVPSIPTSSKLGSILPTMNGLYPSGTSSDSNHVFALLADYTDSLDSLPLDLTRSFSDLRELDAVLRSTCPSFLFFSATYVCGSTNCADHQLTVQLNQHYSLHQRNH